MRTVSTVCRKNNTSEITSRYYEFIPCPTHIRKLHFIVIGHSVATGAPRTSELNIERLSSIVNELLNSTTDDLDPSLILQNFVKHPLLISNFTVPVASVQIQCFGVLVHGLNTVQIHEVCTRTQESINWFCYRVHRAITKYERRTSQLKKNYLDP